MLLAKPEEIGFNPVRLEQAFELVALWTRQGKIPAAGVCVGRKGKMLESRFFGKQHPDKDTPVRKDALFLTASITKPITVTAVMVLVERGLLSLKDPVAAFVPKFAANGKKDVLIHHLMTHTSGLPDMLSNNDQLRAAHKPFAAFVDEICKLELLFPPGTKVSYQSMGIAMLAEVLHQITGATIQEFLQKEIFGPLAMADTSLGGQPVKRERLAAVRLTLEQQKTDWNWMSPYWLGFGACWGAMITSPADFGRYCLMMLGGGSLEGVRIVSPATVRAMTSNQLNGLTQLSEEERRCRPWGLGWRLNWLGSSSPFSDLLGPRAYGHWGATGTLCWMDPETDSFGAIFTTEPQADGDKLLTRFANSVVAAMEC